MKLSLGGGGAEDGVTTVNCFPHPSAKYSRIAAEEYSCKTQDVSQCFSTDSPRHESLKCVAMFVIRMYLYALESSAQSVVPVVIIRS
jgi:hypothetical protein